MKPDYRQWLRGLGMLAAAFCAQATAHLPEQFGRDYVLEPAPAAPGAPAAEEGDALSEARELEALEAALKEQTSRLGPYSPELSDPLLQLAARRARSGNAVAALRHYEQALHLLRVNNGLLHPVQLPLLRELAELYRQIGDWRSGQLTWRYAYRIHGLGESVVDGQALEDALAYFAFARDAYIAPNSPQDDRLFLQAYLDNEALFERSSETGSRNPDALRALGISFLRNLYVLLGTDPFSFTANAGGLASGNRMLTLQDLGVGKGLKVLDLLIDAAQDETAVARATLRLRRANWLQWNGKWRSARDDYAAIFTLLDDSEAAQGLRARLAQPAELPEDVELWRSLQSSDTPIRGVFLASYLVKKRGSSAGVDVEPADESGQGRAGTLRRMLADSHFRPALRDGETIEARVDRRRYRLID